MKRVSDYLLQELNYLFVDKKEILVNLKNTERFCKESNFKMQLNWIRQIIKVYEKNINEHQTTIRKRIIPFLNYEFTEARREMREEYKKRQDETDTREQ